MTLAILSLRFPARIVGANSFPRAGRFGRPTLEGIRRHRVPASGFEGGQGAIHKGSLIFEERNFNMLKVHHLPKTTSKTDLARITSIESSSCVVKSVMKSPLFALQNKRLNALSRLNGERQEW